MGGEPRHRRLPPVAVPPARHRAPGRAADRHRPAAGNDVRATASASRRSCARSLAEIGYTGWPKTSGNRGIHIACRIEPLWEFPVVRRAALAFAREIERRLPKLVTTAWWKEERGKRVFIDYNQNARDRTIASAYSARARRDATVSAPVTWDELPDVETEDFTLATMPATVREARRRAGRDRRHDLRPAGPARMGGARREGRPRRGAVPAELPEDAGRAAPRAALASPEARESM